MEMRFSKVGGASTYLQLGMLTIPYTGMAIYAMGGRQLCGVNWIDHWSEFFEDLLDGYRCHTTGSTGLKTMNFCNISSFLV